jgi:glucuronate isomerase
MKLFLDENFLLETKTAEYLYHEHAKKLAIIDYHSHLDPRLINDNVQFENITQAWLYGDHYKWRAMRTNGVDERYCTGDAGDYEKFEKWAETVPFTLRNPLYHWTHMELRRYFNINHLLSHTTARNIYDETSSMLKSDDYSIRSLLRKMNVEVVCTTDDPIDSLEYHLRIKGEGLDTKVLPTWRPDKAMAVEDPIRFNFYIDRLCETAGLNISKYSRLIDAIKKRHDYFHMHGCRLSDHGLENFYSEPYTDEEVNQIFNKVRSGTSLAPQEEIKIKSALLYELAKMNHERGWVQQFHVGAIRNNNSRMKAKIGTDAGFDSIGDNQIASAMSKFLDKLDSEAKLAKTILYNLNPADNEIMATMIGNFQDGKTPGKIQWGPGWWFLDQKDGIERQLNTLSHLGLLSRFVGMVTDSRSFLSYPRHEYFRRILCNLLGKDVENGELPNDMNLLGKMVEDICYNNAKSYFGF